MIVFLHGRYMRRGLCMSSFPRSAQLPRNVNRHTVVHISGVRPACRMQRICRSNCPTRYLGCVYHVCPSAVWDSNCHTRRSLQELTNACDRKRWSHFHVAEKVNTCLFSFGAMSVLGALLSFSVPLFIASLLPLLVHCLTSTILVHEEHL